MSRDGESRHVLIASRIFAPEPAAASLRLRVLAEELAVAGYDVEVLTTTAPASPPPQDPAGVHVVRWPALRNADGYIRGYLGYLSFDIPLLFRLLLRRRPDVVVCEPPPTSG
ncbi:MAG: glycosyltransferase WbuB, partial [Actinobacteria bacterium]|nr:glycosyltransferase WbuB [Actinomycetota bacterium]